MFEFLIFGGIGGIFGSLWPLLIIGAGAYLLTRNCEGRLGNRKLLLDDKPKRASKVPPPKYAGPSAEIDPELRRKIDAALADEGGILADSNGKPTSDEVRIV
jgi:hypothetical protein